jgi:hypothetical protein
MLSVHWPTIWIRDRLQNSTLEGKERESSPALPMRLREGSPEILGMSWHGMTVPFQRVGRTREGVERRLLQWERVRDGLHTLPWAAQGGLGPATL